MNQETVLLHHSRISQLVWIIYLRNPDPYYCMETVHSYHSWIQSNTMIAEPFKVDMKDYYKEVPKYAHVIEKINCNCDTT